MKRRSSNFERKADERHDDACCKQGLHRRDRQFVRDRSETSAPRHAINQTDAEQRERAGGAAKQKILQTCFRGSHIGPVECSHHVKRKAQQFEPDENHEQLFTANEQHEADGCQKNNRQIFAWMTQGFF